MLIILIYSICCDYLIEKRKCYINLKNFKKFIKKNYSLNSSIFFTVEVVGIKIIKGDYLYFINNYILITV